MVAEYLCFHGNINLLYVLSVLPVLNGNFLLALQIGIKAILFSHDKQQRV